jgi:uncharacterized repeat protein (TIGR01451 family)
MATAIAVRNHKPTWCIASMAIMVGLTLAGVPTARADQQFIMGSTAWSGPAGSAGVIYQVGAPMEPDSIWVDANGDALENFGDTHHPIPSGITSQWTLRLSPTRTIMTATLGSGGSCTPETTLVRVFAIPIGNTAMTERGSQQTLYHCLNPTLFYDPGPTAPFRTALFREVGTVGDDPKFLWWDLVTGSAAPSAFPYLVTTGFVEFAPSGTMALVQHDVNGPGGTNYSLVNLCPAQIGQASQPGYEYGGVLHAWVLPGPPVAIQFRDASDGSIHGGGPYVDCAAGDPLGACCASNGTCSNTVQADCAGTWHPEGLCAVVTCPSAQLAVSMTGPASVELGAPAAFTLTARNNGALASGSVVVTDLIPSGSAFVSATNGGTYSAATGQVTWNLGTLSGGQQTAMTVTVAAPCFGTSMANVTYTISGSPGGIVAGTPFVNTTLTAPNTAGLTLTLLSSALDPTPLQTGGRTRHTIRMTNALATPRNGINFSVNAGTVSRMLQVVNNGGGSPTLTTSNLSWTGNLPASSTTDVVYDTEIIACRSSQSAVETINNGAGVFLKNVCGTFLVFAIPSQSIPVAPAPFSAQLQSPSHGPVQTWGATNTNRMIVCRPGDAVDVDLWISNVSGAPSPSANMSLTLPAELVAATNPPFLGSPPAGTQWDASSSTISWSGQIPANDTLVISFRILMSPSACSGSLDAIGGFGTCLNFLHTNLSILSVSVPPPTHLLALHGSDGLWYLDPLAPQDWKPLLCGTFEALRGFGRTPDSTIWVAGVPSFKLNPYHLSFQIFPPSFLTSLGMDWAYDAAGDARDSTVVFGGYLSGFGLRLRRYNPRTGQVSVILNDTSPLTLGIARSVTVSSDGLIGVNTNTNVLRVNPANPGAYQKFTPPGGGVINGLCLDDDGNWLTTGKPASSSAPRNLEKVNRQSGAYSSIVDVGSSFNWFVEMPAITNSPNLDVYLGSGDAVFGRVQRAAGNAVTTSTVPVTITDLLWTGPATVAVDPPGARGAPGALALSPPYPNPARAGVRLGFVLPEAGHATLALYDIGGRRVRTLADASLDAGSHTVSWDGTSDAGSRLGAGLYFVKLVTRQGERIAKLVLAH